MLSLSPGLFTITARVLPDGSIGAVEETILRELEALASGGGQDDDLERARQQLESGFIFSLDALMNQALLLAQYEICASWRLLGEYVSGVRGVRLDDIQRVVGTYFVEGNRSVGWLIPGIGRTP
jgi:predicted Zn-dependent peptidase